MMMTARGLFGGGSGFVIKVLLEMKVISES